MATGNFCYENRCVVVTDDDYEIGNLPEMGECVDNSRNYPSYLIEEFEFWVVVLTAGYYEGACIDYIEHHKRSPYDVVQGYIGYPSTKKKNSLRNVKKHSACQDGKCKLFAETSEIWILMTMLRKQLKR